jgi:hypothetical protein
LPCTAGIGQWLQFNPVLALAGAWVAGKGSRGLWGTVAGFRWSAVCVQW